MSRITISAVRRIVQEARNESRTPDLRGANLRGADLYGANLRGVDLYGANLLGVDLYGVDLRGANLRGANLRGANLYGANLRGANLYGANLRGANLYGANLLGANGWNGLQITGLHKYQIVLTPTPRGWHITIGCWQGTPDELESLIAQDDGWPESEGEQITRNRALLEAALTAIRAHIDAHPDAISDAAEAHQKWSDHDDAD